MVAMFFIPLVIISCCIYKFQRWKFMYDNRKHSIEEGLDFYTDMNGLQRKISDNHAFFERRNLDGDWCEYDPFTDRLIRNIDQEKRDKIYDENRRKALDNGDLFFRIGLLRDNHSHDKIKGTRYVCTDDGEIYVKRAMFGMIAYMRVKDGYFTDINQITDEHKERIKKLNERQQEKFDDFNQFYIG